MSQATLVLRGRHFQSNEIVDVVIADGRIHAIRAAQGPADLVGKNSYLLPGLVDLQVNGYAGHDLNSADGSATVVALLAQRLVETGVTRFCPTVTTAPLDWITRNVKAIRDACEEDDLVKAMILGIHLEGPYISPDDGPRGAHPQQFVRQPDWDEFQHFQEACGGQIKLVTLAPELPGALGFIERAVATGVVIAIGHTGASGSQIADAISAGASLSTHLGNGAHVVLPRHPNYLWDQLADDRLMASIIVDGFHLPPSVVKVFLRAKGVKRTILISDAMFAAGMPPGTYEFMGREVELGKEGVVRLVGTPFLAGSALPLWQAVKNIRQFAGASFADAAQMACLNPASLLSAENACGQLSPGDPANVIVLNGDGNDLRLLATVVDGRVRWRA